MSLVEMWVLAAVVRGNEEELWRCYPDGDDSGEKMLLLVGSTNTAGFRSQHTVEVIEESGIHLCAGALVGPQDILVAGECAGAGPMYISLGYDTSNATSAREKSVDLPINTIKFHDQSDIALLKVDGIIHHIPFSLKPPPCSKDKWRVHSLGWFKPYNYEAPMDHLRHMYMKIVQANACKDALKGFDVRKTDGICAIAEDYEHVTNEWDLGSPLYVSCPSGSDDYLIGLAANQTAMTNGWAIPDLYIDLAPLYSWVEKNKFLT